MAYKYKSSVRLTIDYLVETENPSDHEALVKHFAKIPREGRGLESGAFRITPAMQPEETMLGCLVYKSKKSKDRQNDGDTNSD